MFKGLGSFTGDIKVPQYRQKDHVLLLARVLQEKSAKGASTTRKHYFLGGILTTSGVLGLASKGCGPRV